MTPRTIELAGREVPRIGLGTNRLSSSPEHQEFLREAAGAGLGTIDTAHLYSGGDSEIAIGEALSDSAVVIATKGGYSGSGSPEALREQIATSLERLRTEVIDLYYLHRVDPETPLEVSLGEIAKHRDEGKIREVGVSAVSVEEIEAARKVAPIAAVQNHYNGSERESEEVIDYCEENGIVFVPYFPLRELPEAAEEVAEKRGTTPHQIALAWLLHRSPVMLPIPGTLSLEHLRENLAALEIELTDEEVETLS